MGRGIAQAAALAGLPTLLYDLDPAGLERARAAITAGLQGLVSRGRIGQDKAEGALQRLRYSPDLDDCRADLLLEAIIENLDSKMNLLRQLAARNTPEACYATNTSSLSVTRMADALPDPSRLAGMHFFNPVHAMKLVEVVSTVHSDPQVLDALCELARGMGKTPVRCTDTPGFIVNRVARPYYLEALRLAGDPAGLPARYEQIDRVLESCGFPMGPFRLMDLIGNDINYAVSCSVYEQLGRPARLQPAALQQQRVERGELGRKTGKGYYDYPAGPA